MHSVTDSDYLDTKRIKLSGSLLPSPFNALAEWIDAQYEVCVLNLRLDSIGADNRPRLNVVLETVAEQRKFTGGTIPLLSYDATRQLEIRESFATLCAYLPFPKIDPARLLVIFTAFEPVARAEANMRVSEPEIDKMKAGLDNPDLWAIRRGIENVTFFFFTETQVKYNKAAAVQERFANAYARLTAPYDEFGYLAARPIAVHLDSKERFDFAYKSNWAHYYQDH